MNAPTTWTTFAAPSRFYAMAGRFVPWFWAGAWPEAAVAVEQVLEATDHVTPAIEIIDARIEQFDRHTKAMRKVYDTISDNAANAGIVLGAKRVIPHTTDLPWCGAILRLNGVVEETGLAAGGASGPLWPSTISIRRTSGEDTDFRTAGGWSRKGKR